MELDAGNANSAQVESYPRIFKDRQSNVYPQKIVNNLRLIFTALISIFRMSSSEAAEAAATQYDNEWSNKYFAISMGAIMVLFSIKHWTGVLFHHYGPKNSSLPRAYRYGFSDGV